MATVNGVNYASTHAPSDGNWKLVPVSEVGGQLRVLYDSYTTPVTADILNVGRLPKDSRVWDVQVSTSAACGSSTTVSVGFAYDDSSLTDDNDLFLTVTTTASSARYHAMVGGVGLGTIAAGTAATSEVPVTSEGEGVVQATFNGTLSATDVVVKVLVLYTID